MHMTANSQQKQQKSTSYPRDAMLQAEVVIEGWSKVGERLSVPNLDLMKLKQKLREARHFVELAEQMKEKRAMTVQDRNLCLSELWDLTKRVRNSAKATFGDYSPELDLLITNSSSQEEE